MTGAPSAVLRATTEDCGNDCFTAAGHREGCWMHCHCYDGPAEWSPVGPLVASLLTAAFNRTGGTA